MDGQNQIERAAKTLPLVLAALYVVGFLIVASHLAGYGAFSLDLIKVQYLAAGFWFACVLLLFFGITSAVRIPVSEFIYHKASGVRWRSKKATALAGAAVADSFLVMVIVFESYLDQWLNRLWGAPDLLERNQRMMENMHSIRSLVAGLIIFDISSRTWLYMREKADDTAIHELSKRHTWRMVTTIIVMIFVTCILQFAKDLYPRIPYSLGGGQTRQVKFWLGPGTAFDSFLERDGTTPYTVPYELLLENDNSFAVISPKDNQRSIEFDRKAVGGVIVLGKRPKSAPANFRREVTEPASNKYEVIERSQKQVSNFMAKGLHTEVDYVLLHDGHKFYAVCDTTTLDKLDPTATCAFRVLRSYECVQPADKEPNKALSDLRCKDDESHPVYLYVSKKE